MTMMKSAQAYYSEVFEDLCNSEMAHLHDFNNSDVDDLIIEEIHSRIWAKLLATNSLVLLDPDSGDPPMHIDKWIADNPESVEARTLLWIG